MKILSLGMVVAVAGLVIASAPAPAFAVSTPPAASAEEITWQDFVPAAFRRALIEERLVLLVLENPWSDLCKKAREEVWDDPEVVRVVRANYSAVRVRADLRPDLARRYPAEGWPAISLLLPDGSALFLKVGDPPVPRRVGSGFQPAAEMASFLRGASTAYQADRNGAAKLSREQDELIERTSRPQGAPTTDAVVWGLAGDVRATFDPERRYFGGAPRLPRFELIELMLTLGGEAVDPWQTLGLAALETLTTKLADPQDGGLQRMALGLDWEEPQKEKLLDRNARHLDMLTLAWRVTGKKSDRERVVKAANFLTTKLSRTDGSFAAALAPDAVGGRDETVLSGPNGLAAAALIRAGAAIRDPAIVHRGLMAAAFLKDKRWKSGVLVPRAVIDGEAPLADNLEDQVQVAWAFLSAYEVTGERSWLAAAEDLAAATINNLTEPKLGALRDIIPQPSAPRPLRRALYPLNANSDFVRVLVRLYYLTEGKRYQHAARTILTAYGKTRGGTQIWLPNYALAAYEFHYPPITVAVMGGAQDEKADGLRAAAFGAAFPFVVVRSFDPQLDRDAAQALSLPFAAHPTLIGFHSGLFSQPQSDPGAVRGVLAELRERFVAQTKPPEVRPMPTPPERGGRRETGPPPAPPPPDGQP